MTKIKFCLNCGEDVTIEDGEVGHTKLHFQINSDAHLTEPEVEFCLGPFVESNEFVFNIDIDDIATDEWFAQSDMHEIDPDWDMNLDEPSPEELAMMSLNAEILMQEIESQ